MITQQITEMILCCDEYFQHLLKDIDRAKESILLETYIFDNDPLTDKVCAWLAKASVRGVNVRLMVDGFGTPTISSSNLEILKTSGVKLRVYHPLPWKWWQLKHSNIKSSLFSQLSYLFFQLNSRDHRKICLIDQKIAYIGSANISQKHLPKKLGGEEWTDTAIRITGIDFSALEIAFNIAWYSYLRPQKVYRSIKPINLNSALRLNYMRYLRRVLYKDLLRRILTAKERVWLTIAYFNPDYYLLKYLILLAKSGVDVKLILPHESDVIFMPLVALTFYEKLLKANVQIYEYLPSILHSKILIIDDWFCVGSSNLNHRSLRHDLEIDAVIQTSAAKKTLDKIFLDNLDHSRRIYLKDLHKQSIFGKILGQLLLFIRYYM